MTARWIDLTATLRPGITHWPGDPPFKIRRFADMSAGDEVNATLLTMSAHTGTHMDAPRHFFANGATLDSMPLDAVVGPARIIAIDDPSAIELAELRRNRIRTGERILFKTRNSNSPWDAEKFTKEYVSISPDAARFLAERRVRCVDVDYLSVGGFGPEGRETHEALLGAGVWIIEGLKLSEVDAGDYDLVCLPLRILDSDGAPARAIVRRRARSPR